MPQLFSPIGRVTTGSRTESFIRSFFLSSNPYFTYTSLEPIHALPIIKICNTNYKLKSGAECTNLGNPSEMVGMVREKRGEKSKCYFSKSKLQTGVYQHRTIWFKTQVLFLGMSSFVVENMTLLIRFHSQA